MLLLLLFVIILLLFHLFIIVLFFFFDKEICLASNLPVYRFNPSPSGGEGMGTCMVIGWEEAYLFQAQALVQEPAGRDFAFDHLETSPLFGDLTIIRPVIM